MRTKRLSDVEFKATFTNKMRDVTVTATDVLDIWPYVRSIPTADLEGHCIYDDLVEVVYRCDDDHFDHVLVMTKTKTHTASLSLTFTKIRFTGIDCSI